MSSSSPRSFYKPAWALSGWGVDSLTEIKGKILVKDSARFIFFFSPPENATKERKRSEGPISPDSKANRRKLLWGHNKSRCGGRTVPEMGWCKSLPALSGVFFFFHSLCVVRGDVSLCVGVCCVLCGWCTRRMFAHRCCCINAWLSWKTPDSNNLVSPSKRVLLMQDVQCIDY